MVKRIAAIAIGIVAALAFAEAALRVSDPEWLRVRVGTAEDPRTLERFQGDRRWPVEEVDGEVVAFRPGDILEMRNPEYQTVAHVDRWGARSTGLDPARASGLIPIVGDSQTFGVGVADDQTFASLLGRRLNQPFLNLGIPGTAIRGQLSVIANRHAAIGAPRVWVICFFAGNDLADLVTRAEVDAREPGVPVQSGLVYRINELVFHQSILRRSYALQLVKLALLGTFAVVPTAQTDDVFRAIDRRRVNFRATAARELARYIDQLVVLAARLGFRPVFMVIPGRYQVSPALIERARRMYWLARNDVDVRYPNRLLRETLAARGIPLIDPLDCMMNRDGLYYRESHMTPAGHRAFADCVAAPLAPLLR